MKSPFGGRMARCELTGKSPVVKNLVSHSNIKTKSTAMPNIQKKRIYSSTLDESVTLKVATTTLKSMEHSGGFDKYILNRPQKTLSKRALAVQSRIRRKISKAKTAN
jgi:large subunit ribosomal protein L28